MAHRTHRRRARRTLHEARSVERIMLVIDRGVAAIASLSPERREFELAKLESVSPLWLSVLVRTLTEPKRD
jgi:hypothetical protein